MNKKTAVEIIRVLDLQQQNCEYLGAKKSNLLKLPEDGDKLQNCFYYGMLCLAESIAINNGLLLEKDEQCNHHFRKRGVADVL